MPMTEEDIRETTRLRIRNWFSERACKGDKEVGESLMLSEDGITLAANQAVALSREYLEQMDKQKTRGICHHKVAAVIACGISIYRASILKNKHARKHKYQISSLREELLQNCCVDVLISLVDCDYRAVQSNEDVFNALINLFKEHKRVSMYTVSMIAFLLEKSYPPLPPAPLAAPPTPVPG